MCLEFQSPCTIWNLASLSTLELRLPAPELVAASVGGRSRWEAGLGRGGTLGVGQVFCHPLVLGRIDSLSKLNPLNLTRNQMGNLHKFGIHFNAEVLHLQGTDSTGV